MDPEPNVSRRRAESPAPARTRVVVAEDSGVLREGIVRLLIDAGFDVVASCGDADTLLDGVRSAVPDLVVVDVRMPPTFTEEGLRAARAIRMQWPGVAVLILSQYVEPALAVPSSSRRPAGTGALATTP